MIPVIVPISKAFYWELHPFFLLFQRFWAEEWDIRVLCPGGYDRGFPCVHAPVDPPVLRGDDWDWGWFVEGLYKYLNSIDDPLVIIMMADYWITERVDLTLLDILGEYMEIRTDVVRMQISKHTAYYRDMTLTERYKGIKIRDCPEHNPRCVLLASLIPAIWRRELLVNVLSDCEMKWNAWHFETEGSEKIVQRGYRVSSPFPFCFTYEQVAATRRGRVDLSAMPADLRGCIRPFIPSRITMKGKRIKMVVT